MANGGGGGGGNLPPLATVVGANVAPFVSGIDKAIASLGTFQGAAIAGAGALGILGTKGIKASIDRFAEFDQKMTESQAIMGELSGETIAEMEEAAIDVGATSLKTADEAAESYFFLASAGLDAKQSIAALPQVAAFAQAGMFDMATATDLATDAQSALGLKAEDTTENLRGLTRVTDVLVRANQLANASVEQFSESITNKLGARIRILDKDIEEATAGLAALADQGIKGRRAGRGLSIVYRDLAREAVRSADAFEELGIRVFDNEGNMRNLADIVRDFERELGGASDRTKTAKLQMLGINRRAIGFLNALIGLSDEIENYERELRSAGGATREVADKQIDTLRNQVHLLKGEWEGLVLELGSGTTELLGISDAVSWLRVRLRAIREAEGTFETLHTGLEVFADAFTPDFAFEMEKAEAAIARVRRELDREARAGGAARKATEEFVDEAIRPFEKIEFSDRLKTLRELTENQQEAERALALARHEAQIQADEDLEAILALRRQELEAAIDAGEGVEAAAAKVAETEIRIAERREDELKRIRDAAAEEVAEGLAEETETLIEEVEERRERMRALAGDRGDIARQAISPFAGLIPGFTALDDALSRFEDQTSRTSDSTTSDLSRVEKTMDELGLSADDLGVDLDDLSREELARLQDRLRLIRNTAQEMASGVTEAFNEMIFEGRSLASGIEGIVKSILSSLQKLAIQKGVTEPLTKVFASALGGALGGGGGGAEGRARGGPVAPGQVVIVGESGPEPFVAGVGGRVESNKKLREAAGGGGGGRTVNVKAEFNVQALDARTTEQVLRQQGARAVVDIVKQAAEESQGFSRKTVAG